MPRKRQNEPLIAVRPSAIAGLGVFAARRIPRGTRIIEYTGERITDEEAGRRYDDDAMDHHHTFLFAIDDDMVIDGGVDGNDARYFNHGCAPNCEAVNEDGRIFIEAIADVEAGTELCYDYALVREDTWQDRWAELYACRCGAAKCRGLILKSPRPPRRSKGGGRRASAKTVKGTVQGSVQRRPATSPAPRKPVSDRRSSRAGARRGATAGR